ncbi:MAG: SagB family peptide dehydrogenase [Acidobacteria bacterium]|nr:SagB family peptide dehydrogenase [Acidobacteriota bacterium]
MTLACYWRDKRLIAQNYATGRRAAATPLVIDILDYCSTWRSADAMCRRFASYPRKGLLHLVRLLEARTLLNRVREDDGSIDPALDGWRDWMPEAAFFHFATKDARYEEAAATSARLRRKAASEPPPPPVKTYPRARRTPLPAAAAPSALGDVLRARRTWRRFGAAPVTSTELATLLGLTWGVQGWAETSLGRCALKTSPSGGARHPLEAYLVARRVDGVKPGLYYYDGDRHGLVSIGTRMTARRFERYLPAQPWFHEAPALVVMTAVFARTQWRYRSARAYRVVLLEAGHFCQTFCLLATALGLAPFCTAALDDRSIEHDLGVDGVTESVIYACGVGSRPRGATWAPWGPTRAPLPRIAPPASRSPRVRPRR